VALLNMQKCAICRQITNKHVLDVELGYVCKDDWKFVLLAMEVLVNTPGIRVPLIDEKKPRG
jgi:hypothetical protein